MQAGKYASKALALLLALALALLCAVPAFAASTPEAGLAAVLNYLDGKKASMAFAAGESEWKALAMARGGKSVPAAYLTSLENAVKAGPLSAATDYARTVLALTAMGVNAASFANTDLTAPLKNKTFVTDSIPNGPTFALLALNSKLYTYPSGYDLELVDVLVGAFSNTAGWNPGGIYAPVGMDIDATAMALQALAPYYSRTNVKTVVDKALALLTAAQLTGGAFGNDWGGGAFDDACSTAQVITALSILGKDAAAYFPKNAVAALLTFQESNGAFDIAYGENPWADSQAAYALVAYNRYKTGANSLYNMGPEPTRLDRWEAKLPGWLGFLKAWPDWIEWIVYYVFFGWIWDVIS